jgi:methyl-accepting chemotaxis protein
MNWFHDMKISFKLLICFTLLALVAGLVGYVGINQIQTIAEADAQMYHQMTVPIAHLTDLNKSVLDIRMGVRDLMLSRSADESQTYYENQRLFEIEIRGILEEFEQSLITAEEEAIFRNFSRRLEEYFTHLERFIGFLNVGENDRALNYMRGDFLNIAVAIDNDLNALRENKIIMAQATAENNSAIARRAVITMIVFMASGMILAIVLGFFVSAAVGKPLKEMAETCDHLVTGDLDHSITWKSRDEVGVLAEAFRKIIDSQKELVSVATMISEGKLDVDIRLRGEKDTLSMAMQNMIRSLNGLVEETVVLTKSASDGRMSVRGNADAYHGAYNAIIRGINNTLDAVAAPIDEAMSVLEKVAERDLTARVSGDYKGDFAKIKESLNMAFQNLEDALVQVSAGSEQVAVASGQISTGSQTLSQGASEQASSLEEVSSSLQEMSSMTRKNTDNAKEALKLSESASESTAKGVGSMKRLSAAIDEIKESSDSTAKIIKTIDEIAFQTNLLALNAAVEAARAGDAGKGFAVVAEEVRNLAMRSAAAAKNTADLIEESVRKSEGGVEINQEVLRNLDKINDHVNKVRAVMNDIVMASDQQSHGIEQVNTAITQMNQVTQQTAANAEESASAAQELSSQAAEMKTMVSSFTLSKSTSKLTFQTSGQKSMRMPRKALAPHSKSAERKVGDDKKKSLAEQARALIPFDEVNPDLNDFQF